MSLTRISVEMIVAVAALAVVGCGQLRFAPDELQKQNAWLHERTVEAAAVQARVEESSTTLQSLTAQAAAQSQAISAYYGQPRELPAAGTADDLLAEASVAVTQAARASAMSRPDPWDLADSVLELSLAVAGVIGGVAGTRAVRFLTQAREKSTALREIVQNNELFKQTRPDAAAQFKQAQRQQSTATRQLVAQITQ